MFLKSNVHLKELADFLQENFNEYVFKPDTQLDLIEIITMKNAKKGKHENENVLAVGDDNKVRLIFFEHNSKILDIEKQAKDFMSNFGCLNDFKQENTKKKIINRPEQVVEVAKMLYTGDVFVEKIKGEKTPKIDIVDDILNSISAESKKKFKKEYCDLVAIKYPDKAQALRQQMNVHSLENSSTQSPSKQIENTQKVENKVQQQIRKQLENNSPKAKEIKDDNASVGAGDTLADDEFISDNDEEQFSVFGDDNDEFIENTFNKEETSESKDGLTQEENKEPTEDDLKDLFGNQKQEVAKVEKHVGKEVPKDKQIIDDGTRDRPQTVHSVYKYCVAYHKETVKLEELRKHFSDNAINMSVSNGILTTSMTPDELIFVGNVK